MRMFGWFVFFIFVADVARAEDVAPVAAGDPSSKVIVVQEGSGKMLQAAPKVFVESGSAQLAGSPESGIKPAYRTWEQKCESWKNELRRLNGKNLMIAECGTPTRTQEKIQSESLYTYQSKATYKIRVLGK